MNASEPVSPTAPDSPVAPGPDSACVPATGPSPTPLQVRQGDVLLVPVAAVPADAHPVRRMSGRAVLAEGEATGHAHAIRSSAATLLVSGADRYLRVAAPVTLDHEEHAAIDVVPGTYRVVIQREYVPPEVSPVAFRRVAD